MSFYSQIFVREPYQLLGHKRKTRVVPTQSGSRTEVSLNIIRCKLELVRYRARVGYIFGLALLQKNENTKTKDSRKTNRSKMAFFGRLPSRINPLPLFLIFATERHKPNGHLKSNVRVHCMINGGNFIMSVVI